MSKAFKMKDVDDEIVKIIEEASQEPEQAADKTGIKEKMLQRVKQRQRGG